MQAPTTLFTSSFFTRKIFVISTEVEKSFPYYRKNIPIQIRYKYLTNSDFFCILSSPHRKCGKQGTFNKRGTIMPQVRKIFWLCDCGKTIPHGYFLDENWGRFIPPPIFSIRDGQKWIKIFEKSKTITEQEATLLSEDVRLSRLPTEHVYDLTALATNFVDSRNQPPNKNSTINESGVNEEQDPWL